MDTTTSGSSPTPPPTTPAASTPAASAAPSMPPPPPAAATSSSHKTPHPSRMWALAGVLAVIVLGAGIWEYEQWQKAHYAYTIPGVPSVDMYSSEVLNAPYDFTVHNPGIAALVDLLRYWGEAASSTDPVLMQQLADLYTGGTGQLDPIKLQQFFATKGYTVETLRIINLQDAEKYISSHEGTPLLFSQPLATSTPNLPNTALLIGIDLPHGVIITNDFYHGQAYEMPLANFTQLWNAHPYRLTRYQYFAIYPTDPARRSAAVTAHIGTAYAPRTAPEDALGPLLPAYVTFRRMATPQVESATTTLIELAYVQQITRSPLFTYFHPSIQTNLYAWRSILESRLGQYPMALADANTAIAMDKNLDAPIAGWGQLVRAQVPLPYSALAIYYKYTGNKTASAKAAAQAAAIASSTSSGQ